jgi:hypothetical protein
MNAPLRVPTNTRTLLIVDALLQRLRAGVPPRAMWSSTLKALLEAASIAAACDRRGHNRASLHNAGISSFQAFKLMTAGEGGPVLSNDNDFSNEHAIALSAGWGQLDNGRDDPSRLGR